MNEIGTTTPDKSKALIIGASVLCAAGIASAVTAMIFAFATPAGAHNAAVPPAQHTVAPAVPVTPANHPHTNPPVNPLPNQELPASQVRTIQRELGQLNYYEGPVDGIMGPQTVQAIKYLQRDAQLPQTGYYDQVTYLALQHMLATGNNQMGN